LFSDDAILGAQNVLATFTNIKGVGFEDATGAILDISQALGTDLQSATIQVGKALNDPTQGISALSRVGVSFTEQQKQQIETMQEAGDMAGAQAIIIAELNKEFGGSAAAAVNTYTGQMTVLTEQFNDVKGSVGEALLPILMELGRFAVAYVVPAVQQMAAAFTEWINSVDWVGLMSLFETIFTTISDAITSVDWNGVFATIGEAVGALMTTFQTLREVFYTVLGAITTQVDIFWGIVGPVWDQLVAVFADAMAQLSPLGAVLDDAFGGIQEQGQAMAPIGEFLGQIVTAIMNVVGVLVQILVPIIRFVFPLIVGYIKDVIQNFINIYNTIQYVFSGQLSRDIATWWTNTINGITEKINGFIATIKSIGKNIMQGLMDGVESMRQKLYDTFGGIVSGAVSWLKNLLGIASPSKLMAETIGRPMGQGIAAGILSTVGDVGGALSSTTGAATMSTINNYYQLTANYASTQSESTIMADLRMMQSVYGGA
jgi:phage-related protein